MKSLKEPDAGKHSQLPTRMLFYCLLKIGKFRSFVFQHHPTLPKEIIMSLDQARSFIEKMKSDVAFSERVMAVEDVDARLAYIQSKGYECSEAEIKEVSGELNDVELDNVAGGVVKTIFWGMSYQC